MTSELNKVAKTKDWSEVYNLAENFRQQEQWKNAAEALERAIELRPNFFWSYHHLGDAYTKLGQWKKAAKAYARAVKIDPQFSWSWHNLGDALSKLKQWHNAAKCYGRAVKLDPKFFWSWHNLGVAFDRLEKYEPAITCYLQGIYLQPEYQSYQKLGTAFKQQDNLAQSIEHYRQVIQTPPHNSVFELLRSEPQTLIDLAHKLTTEHQIYGAIVICYMVLEVKPTNTEILLHLSQLLRSKERLEKAISDNQQQLETNHNSSLLDRAAKTPTKKAQSIAGRIAIENRGVVSPRQINDLCVSVGWISRSLNKLEQALNTSHTYVTAWQMPEETETRRLVGFARAVSDGVYQAILLDIAVHPDFQGRGIGKAIVENLTEQLHAAQVADITLFASPHVTDFYHRLGFISQPQNLKWMLWCPPREQVVEK